MTPDELLDAYNNAVSEWDRVGNPEDVERVKTLRAEIVAILSRSHVIDQAEVAPYDEAVRLLRAYEALKAFDNYGSGDLDVCIREIKTVVSEQRTRIDELLEDNTRLENERRKYKVMFEASRELFAEVMLNAPIMARFYGLTGPNAAPLAAELLGAYEKVAARNEQLERDAWSRVPSLVREFVATKSSEDHRFYRENPDLLEQFVEEWRAKFEAALK